MSDMDEFPAAETPTLHLSLETIVDRFLHHKIFRENITAYKFIPAKDADYTAFPDDLDVSIVAALQTAGIHQLYTHQAEAWRKIRSGANVVIETPTASGKTLCYNLPVLQAILENPESRALYIFPTKALSMDQAVEFNRLVAALDSKIVINTFDGDTPPNIRQQIRKQANVIISNPDMLHQGILPHHTKWVKLFQNLRYVVIDELHAYRGIFGSHFANVIRRLKRICRFYGSQPQFICSSATIANPREHAFNLMEEDVELIDQSGAPTNARHFMFFNPPIIDKELGIRASYLKQTRNLARILLENEIDTIIFGLSRLNVEILTKYLKDDFERGRGEALRQEIIVGYRGGYLARRRKEIEAGLKESKIKCVVATNALELGIDIGGLDASLIAGYPGTISSTWQQAGRAGRRGRLSLSILVGRSNPVDQFILAHPEFFFGKSPETARINPNNLILLLEHLKCAAFELPFRKGEQFGTISADDLQALLEYLHQSEIIQPVNDRWHWTSQTYPAADVSLRNISAENFVVVDRSGGERIIGNVDYNMASSTVYPGAVYLLDGNQYVVEELDWDGRRAFVKPSPGEYFTTPIDYTHVKILDIFEERKAGPIRIEHGEIQAISKAVGFKKIKFYSSENVGYGQINLPEQEIVTSAYWFTIPQSQLDELPFSRSENIDGILGLSYAMHHMAAFLLMSEVGDLHRAIGDKSAEWYVRSLQNDRGVYPQKKWDEEKPIDLSAMDEFQPTIFVYDNYPGGIGLSEELYLHHEELLDKTLRLIRDCSCKEGCPACVGPPAEVGQKARFVAIEILNLLQRRI